MRDEYEDEYYADYEESQPSWIARVAGRASKWVGAALALAVIVAVLLWTYGLGQRDAGAIPVIKAALEPAKVQPDDPGGAVIPHQDITSYNAGDSISAPPNISLGSPPQRPAEEDVPMGTLQGDVASTEPVAELPAPPAVIPGTGTEFAPDSAGQARERPADLSARMAMAQQAVSNETELSDRAASSAVQIQLGAYPDRELTKTEWERIYEANQDILTGRALVVQSTISGGRRFFRLRVGPFADRGEAQNVCRALQARGMDCLVAVNG